MAEYAAADGTKFTDEDVERWAAEAEAGFPGWKFGPSTPGPPRPGRPVSVGEDARPFTLRLDMARRAKLEEAAAERHVTMSQLVRSLIDAL